MVNPTGYTALDMIGFTDQGTYSSSDNYVKNDLVHYSGNIWRCLIDDTTGIAPAEGVNWTLFVGEPTNLVERIIAPVETDPATSAWAVGRQIIFNDNLYEVITAISAGDALVAYEDDPTNANIKLADPVETQLLDLKGNLSNRNLLDNAWFTVNQRGDSSYTGNGIYTFDRWKISGENAAISKDSSTGILTFSATATYSSLNQKFPSDYLEVGKKYTISVMFSDGTIESHTFTTVNGNAPFIQWEHDPSFHTLVTNEYLNQWQVFIFDYLSTAGTTNSVSFKAVKLELGSISTLAMDTAPNYAEELLKCQRYFVRVGSTSRIYLGTAIALDNDKATCVIKLPTTMRTVPTVTNITNLELSKGSSIAITALDSRDYNNGYLTLTVSASGTAVGSCYLLRVKADANIDFSADL